MTPCHPEHPPISVTVPHGQDVFAHWLHTCSLDAWEPLSPEAAKPYHFIWQAWLKFLSSQLVPTPSDSKAQSDSEVTWTQASPELVLRFLNQATRSQKKLDMPTDITRRRYWRVLDRIYAHAEMHGWVPSNPVVGLAAQDIPPSEDPKGAILAPAMWAALEKQIPHATDLISARDRAVLFLLMHLGITSEEVRALEIDNVDFNEPKSAYGELHILGEREKQSRCMPLTRQSALALREWLEFRSAYAAMQGQKALFCTRKAPMLSTHTVLHLVTKTIKAAALSHDLPVPPRLGPQAVRNTVIVQWLREGLSVEEVLDKAGLKSPHALLHLKDLIN